MPARSIHMGSYGLTEALKNRKQIFITVIGRLSGRRITVPVWFVAEENTIWLLPVNGSHTQWYRNLNASRVITIQAGNARREVRATLLKSKPAVRKVIQRFQQKYTAEQVKRWYTTFDTAVRVPLGARNV